MKFGVLGNCQASGFARCLEAVAPGHEILIVGLDRLPPGSDHAELAHQLLACDVVFTHQLGDERFGPLRTAELEVRAARLILYPNIVFTGFFPDCVYLRDQDGKLIRGGADAYHSALTTACFLHGLSLDRAMRLHNAYVYASLGYFEAYERDRQLLHQQFATLGYMFKYAVQNCPPVFMHTVNHPRIEVLHNIARQAVRKLGIQPRNAPPPPDELAQGMVWPVYPEIAERLGVEGGHTFQCWTQELTWRDFHAREFEVLGQAPADASRAAVAHASEFLKRECI